jgi:hypothetical protein
MVLRARDRYIHGERVIPCVMHFAWCACQDGSAVEEEAAEEPEVLLLEHFPASETSADASNDNEGGDAEVAALAAAVRKNGRRQEDEEEEEELLLADDMERARALAAAAEAAVAAAEAAARVVRLAALRRLSREERAAVRIQAYYRGYLVRTCPAPTLNRTGSRRLQYNTPTASTSERNSYLSCCLDHEKDMIYPIRIITLFKNFNASLCVRANMHHMMYPFWMGEYTFAS